MGFYKELRNLQKDRDNLLLKKKNSGLSEEEEIRLNYLNLQIKWKKDSQISFIQQRQY
mgnify:CR=1 FL=1